MEKDDDVDLEEKQKNDEDGSEEDFPWDKGWAWMVALGSFLTHFFVVGIVRCYGVLYVQIQEKFGSSTSEASWIGAIMMIVSNFTSPFPASILKQTGPRVAVMIGGLIQGLSFILCMFAESIEVLYVLCGFLFGVGTAFTMGPTKVAVGQYFKDRLAIANAIALCGTSLGLFALPPLITFLLDNYDLSGTWLIMGGVMFNVCVSGAVQRPTSFYQRSSPRQRVDDQTDETDRRHRLRLLTRGRRASSEINLHDNNRRLRCSCRQKSDVLLNGNATGTAIGNATNICSSCGKRVIHAGILSDQIYMRHLAVIPETTKLVHSDGNLNKIRDSSLIRDSSMNRDSIRESNLNRDSIRDSLSIPDDVYLFTSEIDLPEISAIALSQQSIDDDASLSNNNKDERNGCWSRFLRLISRFYDLSILKNRVFLLYTIGNLLCHIGHFCTFRFVPLHARLLGFSDMSAALLLSVLGLGDLFGRVVAGLVADRPFVKIRLQRYRVLSVVSVFLGISTVVLPFMESYVNAMVVCFVLGSITGVYIILFSVSIIDLIGRDDLARAWGGFMLCFGFGMFAEPVIVGLLRDFTGNFRAPFAVCGVLQIVGGVLIMFEHFLLRKRALELMKSQEKLNKSRDI